MQVGMVWQRFLSVSQLRHVPFDDSSQSRYLDNAAAGLAKGLPMMHGAAKIANPSNPGVRVVGWALLVVVSVPALVVACGDENRNPSGDADDGSASGGTGGEEDRGGTGGVSSGTNGGGRGSDGGMAGDPASAGISGAGKAGAGNEGGEGATGNGAAGGGPPTFDCDL